MNVHEATKSYESWLRSCTTVVESDLKLKHKQMRESQFLFLRGTFYRWIQLWPEICSELRDAPRVLAVGDLHVGSFGTWRDIEGRICWGVDDFDESYPLPYTNDLVRLATSVKIGMESGELSLSLKAGCDAILEGYQETLRTDGCPFVLAENEHYLEKLGIEAIKGPSKFWKNLADFPRVGPDLPRDARRALEKTLPHPQPDYKVVRRSAGVGSRGQQRFVAIADWKGGHIAREAKAMISSACSWIEGRGKHRQSFYERAIEGAVRSRDPFQEIDGTWLIRRLSPDSNPIAIEDLNKHRDEEKLLHAMGSEAANVHLGSKSQASKILKDLKRRKPSWLRRAAKEMSRATEKDWEKYVAA